MILFSFCYRVMKCDNDIEDIEDYLDYEDKYNKEFYKLEKVELTKEKIKQLSDAIYNNLHIEDETPNGKIVMYYNFDTSSFSFFSFCATESHLYSRIIHLFP
jgi:hypothetical protein